MLGRWELGSGCRTCRAGSCCFPLTPIPTRMLSPGDRSRQGQGGSKASGSFSAENLLSEPPGFLFVPSGFRRAGKAMFAEDVAACASVRSRIKGLDAEDTEQTCNLTQYVKGRERGAFVLANGLSFRAAAFASGNDARTGQDGSA